MRIETVSNGTFHTICYKGVEYLLIVAENCYTGAGIYAEFGVSVEDIIDPTDLFNLEPIGGGSTSSQTGYKSSYLIEGKRLILDSLYVEHGRCASYPTVMGIMPQTHRSLPGRYYTNLKYLVDYSGEIWLGIPSEQSEENDMNYPRLKDFKILKILRFQRGVLTKCRTLKRIIQCFKNNASKGAIGYSAEDIQDILNKEITSFIQQKKNFRKDLFPKVPSDIEEHPPVPIRPLISFQGKSYDCLVSYSLDNPYSRSFDCWSEWQNVWNVILSDKTKKPSIGEGKWREGFVPKEVAAWSWRGFTEIFSFKKNGAFVLYGLYLHLGKYMPYPQILGITPKIIFETPMIQYYEGLNIECMSSISAVFIIGHRRVEENCRYPFYFGGSDGFFLENSPYLHEYGYDSYIEMTVKNGVLQTFQDVTDAVEQIKTWIEAKPSRNNNLWEIRRHFPDIFRKHTYWFSKYGMEF